MKQVLIIDDSEPIRERLVGLLAEGTQLRIDQAGSGRDAMTIIRRSKPDYVILDIHLKDTSGISLLRELKERYPETTVIMLTNFDFAQYRRQCGRLGADYFFNKAREFERVVDVIKADPAL